MVAIFRFLLQMLYVILVLVIVVLGAAWLFGPRTTVDTTISFDATKIGEDIDGYLMREESGISDIRPGLQKQVIWADPATRNKTPIAIVYIHGFSASSGEVRPLPDLIARAIGANLFYTRLDGHGRAFDAMGDITVNHWINDMAEALAIGEQIGEKVVVLSTLTGGSLVTWALGEPSLVRKISATIFISPNYRTRAKGSFLLTMPFAKQMARLFIGPRRSFQPENEFHKAYSTYDYPVEALLPMAETVKLAANANFQSIDIPAMFVISPNDLVVDPAATRAVAAKWAGPATLVEIADVEDPNNHVLAGHGLAPANTEPLARTMADWIGTTLGQ